MTYHQENEYLDLLEYILEKGKRKKNRTGIDTIGVIGPQMRFDLSDGNFPLLTTKKVFFKGVVHELLWFISGTTNIDYLKNNNVKIWDANYEEYSKRQIEELKKYINEINLGKNIPEEDMNKLIEVESKKYENYLGPIYGFQWRHFGATPYAKNNEKRPKASTMKGMEAYAHGLDQLGCVIDEIRNNPTNRRMIVTAWNPIQIPQMALPPCHVLFHFLVEDDTLNLIMYQRSADFFLGVPFNIASYSLLLSMVAHITNLKPGEFIHNIGDAHIYINHIEQVKEQLSREPYPFPQLKLNPDIKEIDDFKYEDIEIINYKHHPAIKAEMAV